MGAGRKTSTYDIDTRATGGFEQLQRRLGDKLAGCIFGCNNETQDECLTDLVFGLPRAHWPYVQNITRGMPIFLFNYSSRKLHGIFHAVSDGEMDIKPDGWCKGSGSRTMFPAQVRVEVYADCESLTDREYRPILKDCYLEDNRLNFELKKSEAQALCQAFDRKTNRTPAQSASRATSSSQVKEKQPFRPASPPAIAAWGNTGASRPAPQEPPRPSDFPTLSTASSGGKNAADFGPSTTSSMDTGSNATKTVTSTKRQEEESRPKERSYINDSSVKERKSSGGWADEGDKASGSAQRMGSKSWDDVEETPKPLRKQVPASKEPAKEPPTNKPNGQAVDKKPAEQPKPNPKAPAQREEPVVEPAQPKRPSVTGGAGPSSPAKQQKVTNSGPSSTQSPPQASQAQPNGGLNHSDPDQLEIDMGDMQKALEKVDAVASQKLFSVLNALKSQLENATRERILIAQQAELLLGENLELQKIAEQQSHAIAVFKEESAALRRDLEFVGKQVAVTVTPENPSVSDLQVPTVKVRSESSKTILSSISNQNVGMVNGGTEVHQMPTSESLLIFGGNNSKSWLMNVDQFTPSQSDWTQRSQMPEMRGYGAAASAGQSVFIMGGGTGKKWYNSVLRYDAHEEAWYAMANMEEQRGSLGAAAIDGKIYAVGGGLPNYQSETVEILDPELNTWMLGKRMKSKRFAINAAVVENALHVIGGFCEGVYLSSGERLDPREGFWHELPEMENRRGGHAMVAVGTELYALGGWNNDQFMSDVEVYDARKNAWRKFPSLKTPHAYFSAAHLDGKLYVLGGMLDQQNFNDLVEYYDDSEQKWKAVYLKPSEDAHGRKRAFIASCKLP